MSIFRLLPSKPFSPGAQLPPVWGQRQGGVPQVQAILIHNLPIALSQSKLIPSPSGILIWCGWAPSCWGLARQMSFRIEIRRIKSTDQRWFQVEIATYDPIPSSSSQKEPAVPRFLSYWSVAFWQKYVRMLAPVVTLEKLRTNTFEQLKMENEAFQEQVS